MTPRTFVQQGSAEGAKGVFHATTAGLVATMAAYNIAALCFRREKHLAANAVLYTLITALEIRKAVNHFTS
jgi:hypothetical protein